MDVADSVAVAVEVELEVRVEDVAEPVVVEVVEGVVEAFSLPIHPAEKTIIPIKNRTSTLFICSPRTHRAFSLNPF
ncbi:hypothetical protein JCM16138_23160 [Thermococcus atlanticus]